MLRKGWKSVYGHWRDCCQQSKHGIRIYLYISIFLISVNISVPLMMLDMTHYRCACGKVIATNSTYILTNNVLLTNMTKQFIWPHERLTTLTSIWTWAHVYTCDMACFISWTLLTTGITTPNLFRKKQTSLITQFINEQILPTFSYNAFMLLWFTVSNARLSSFTSLCTLILWNPYILEVEGHDWFLSIWMCCFTQCIPIFVWQGQITALEKPINFWA